MRVLLFLFVLRTAVIANGAEAFHFEVYREKPVRRHEPGQISITDSEISYRSDNGKTSFAFPFAEIKEADVSNPASIRIELYDATKWRLGQEKTLRFRLREGEHGEALGRFLAEHLNRPVVSSYALPSD